MTHDIVVVGAGPAGLTAGLYAGRYGRKARLLEKETVGGELVNRHHIEDLPGLPNASGTKLRSAIVDQFRAFDVPITLTTVERIVEDNPFRVETAGGEYLASTVILASGGAPAPLDVPGGADFQGRGVFTCATCDGPLYADGTVAVAGSTDWALTDALFLAEHAAEVVVIEEEPSLSGARILVDRVTSHPAIDVRTDTAITAVRGGDVLQRIELQAAVGGETTLDVDGLYVQDDFEPATDYLNGVVSTTDCGAVVVDQALRTDTDGVFAAGDIRQSSPRTIAAAIGDGVTAFRAANAFLESNG